MSFDAVSAEYGAERQIQIEQTPGLARCAAQDRAAAFFNSTPLSFTRSKSNADFLQRRGAKPTRPLSFKTPRFLKVEICPSRRRSRINFFRSARPLRRPQSTSRTVTGGPASILRGDPAQNLHARHDVEATVEPAAVWDRVDVDRRLAAPVFLMRHANVAHKFPAASVCTSTGNAASFSRSHARALNPGRR